MVDRKQFVFLQLLDRIFNPQPVDVITDKKSLPHHSSLNHKDLDPWRAVEITREQV